MVQPLVIRRIAMRGVTQTPRRKTDRDLDVEVCGKIKSTMIAINLFQMTYGKQANIVPPKGS
jgi:hypothetical protein